MSHSNLTPPHREPLLSKRYRLIEQIGQGAMGTVYRAADLRLARWVAVKSLSQSLVNESMCDRFETEARISAQLCQQSSHIAAVMDYGVDQRNQPFYVMEYLRGQTLREVLSDGPLALPRFFHMMRQICLGLQAAHQGILIEAYPELVPIVHRDIKPVNIWICPDATWGELVKVLDFGIAAVLRANQETSEGYMGTLPYSSPEQLAGDALDPRSDIYSLGILMFEMLTKKFPLRAQTPNHAGWYQAHSQQTPQHLSHFTEYSLPSPLVDLVMACLAKRTSDRPQSIADILNVLEPLSHRYPYEIQAEAVEAAIAPPEPLPPEATTLPTDLKQPVWSSQLPIGRIVIPRTVSTPGSHLPALWVMLPHHQIQTIQINSIYNQIYQQALFCQSPHPMILWVTALYNKRQGASWFRAFLDPKSPQGLEIIRALIQVGEYAILFFDEEKPHFFSHSISVRLTSKRQLQQWLLLSRSLPSVGSPGDSQALLRQAYRELQRTVEQTRFSSTASPEPTGDTEGTLSLHRQHWETGRLTCP